jgi:hypothetical protein
MSCPSGQYPTITGGEVICNSYDDLFRLIAPIDMAMYSGGGVVLQSKPCAGSGTAPAPYRYQAIGEADQSLPITGAVHLRQFARGYALDAQAYGGTPAYANYTFGVYMASAGYSLNFTMQSADVYGELRSHYTPQYLANHPLDSTYTHIPTDNVNNITNGFNDQKAGNLCKVGG